MLEGQYLGKLWTHTRQNELLNGQNPNRPVLAFKDGLPALFKKSGQRSVK